MSIEEKLYLVRFNVDQGRAHIKVNKALCKDCEVKACLSACPVENYKWENDELLFSWEGCMECGTCRLACSKGALEWDYPRGGYGVSFRYG